MRVPKNSSRSARVEAALWAARHEAECNSQKTRDTEPCPLFFEELEVCVAHGAGMQLHVADVADAR